MNDIISWKQEVSKTEIATEYFKREITDKNLDLMLKSATEYFNYKNLSINEVSELFEYLKFKTINSTNIDGSNGRKWVHNLTEVSDEFVTYMGIKDSSYNDEVFQFTFKMSDELLYEQNEENKSAHYRGIIDGNILEYLRRFEPYTETATFVGYEPFAKLWEAGAIDPEITTIRLRLGNLDENYVVEDRENLHGISLKKYEGRPGLHNTKELLEDKLLDSWEIHIHPKWYR